MSTNEPLLQMEGIQKSFGNVKALNGVDFSIGNQQIVGLLGDNGAGKSTLIKVLVGVHQPEVGTIRFNGKEVQFSNPKEAREKGIETVYQDLALIDKMSIMRNFFLGRETTEEKTGLFLDKERMNQTCRKTLEDIGIKVRSPREPVSILSGGERQSIAIGRALFFGAKLLILDEPTSALSIKESKRVLEDAEKAKERGLSVVLISHNVHTVYSVADKITILERGQKLGDYKKEETNADELERLIARPDKLSTENE